MKIEGAPMKPCPFCGRTDLSIEYHGQPAVYFFVSCRCGCIGPIDSAPRTGSGMFDYQQAASSAIDSWNRRAE